MCTAPKVTQPQRLRLIAINPVNNDNNNNNNCILSKEIINLQNLEAKLILRSHDFTFTLANKDYQEVVGHDKRIGGNDEVCYLCYIVYMYLLAFYSIKFIICF